MGLYELLIKYGKYGKQFVCIVLFSIVFSYIYFHPNNEQLLCNTKYKCTVEHQYFHCLTFKNQFDITPNSYLTGNLFMRSASRHAPRIYTYTISPQILNSNNKLIKPFIYYYQGYSRNEDEPEENIENLLGFEINSFNEYLKNPNIGFYLKTQSGDILFLIVVGFSLFAFSMYYVFNFIENGIKNIYSFIKRKFSIHK